MALKTILMCKGFSNTSNDQRRPGTQDEAHRVQGDRGREIHHAQSYQAHHAQCCLYRGEEDIYQDQFLASPRHREELEMALTRMVA